MFTEVPAHMVLPGYNCREQHMPQGLFEDCRSCNRSTVFAAAGMKCVVLVPEVKACT